MSLKQASIMPCWLEEHNANRHEQEIETWVSALERYDNNEFEESLKVFSAIPDTSKILFNCGVIHATLGEHAQAVCLDSPPVSQTYMSNIS